MVWPFNRPEKKNHNFNPMDFKRSNIAAESGRLYNWQSETDRSAEGAVKYALVALHRRSRELVQNEPLAKRYLSLLNTQVIEWHP